MKQQLETVGDDSNLPLGDRDTAAGAAGGGNFHPALGRCSWRSNDSLQYCRDDLFLNNRSFPFPKLAIKYLKCGNLWKNGSV